MRNPIRNETSLVLGVAVIFSAVAIPVFSGFLEPSQPPAVAAVRIGDPGDDDDARTKPDPDTSESRPADDDQAKRRRPAPRPADSAPPSQSAPSAPADDVAEDDGDEAD